VDLKDRLVSRIVEVTFRNGHGRYMETDRHLVTWPGELPCTGACIMSQALTNITEVPGGPEWEVDSVDGETVPPRITLKPETAF